MNIVINITIELFDFFLFLFHLAFQFSYLIEQISFFVHKLHTLFFEIISLLLNTL